MKITLTKATFYFNDPINLTPYARTLNVDLATLDDSVVRKLNLGVNTGVVEIVEGAEEFKNRVEALTTSKEPIREEVTKVETKVETEVTNVLEEVKTETKEVEEVEEVEEPKRKPTTTVKKTVTKKV